MFLGALHQIGHFGSGTTGSTVPVQHVVIGSGDSGIHQTVQLIKQKVREAQTQPVVLQTFRSIVGGLQPTASQTQIAQALTEWVVAHIRYQHDDDMSWTEQGLQWININECPRRFKQCEAVEMVSDAPQILSDRKGDCDDMVLLMGSFLTMAHIQWCPVVVALDPSMRGEFSHIYLVANLDGSFVPIDPVNRNQPFGWSAEGYFRKETLC
jgi:hypothetical protein